MNTKWHINRFMTYNIYSVHMFWLVNILYELWWISEWFVQWYPSSTFSFHRKCAQNGKIRSICAVRTVYNQNGGIPIFIKIKSKKIVIHLLKLFISSPMCEYFGRKSYFCEQKCRKQCVFKGRQKSIIKRCVWYNQ